MDVCEWSYRISPNPEFAICVVLNRLSWSLRYNDVQNIFGRHASYISLVFIDAITYLAKRFRAFLRWDRHRLTLNKLRDYSHHIANSGAGDCVWGFVDGTIQKICRPTEDQRLCYSGHKRIHGFKFQSIVTPDGLISSMSGPIIGSRGDWILWRQSNIEEELRRIFEEEGVSEESQLFLYGDPAYGNSYATMSAFRRPPGGQLSEEQEHFNKAMSRRRISVEHAFGLVKQTWGKHYLSITSRMGSSPVAAIYLVSVLLTNIKTCVRGRNQIADRFRCRPPTVREYLTGAESIHELDDGWDELGQLLDDLDSEVFSAHSDSEMEVL